MNKDVRRGSAAPMLCASLLVLLSTPARAQYQEQGTLGDVASWRSAEYQQDWGLKRLSADAAYAAGITGAGVKIGVMDSGFDASHPEAARFHAVTANGQSADGTPFSVSGQLNPRNDSHGTHVTGTIAAARDGVGMHGVAFNADLYVANTNQNDSFLFGPKPDALYFKAAYNALADAGVRAINNSWGSQPKDVNYQTLDGLHAAYAQHYNQNTWLDAAADVSRRGVINVFSAGNSGVANASVRSALPYFQPDLEGHWLAVSGLDKNNQQKYNQCGIAKYWCIATPGALINSTIPGDGYGVKSGTSMSAPHATGALALVMERYPYLNNQQALEVLLTTSTQLDGSITDTPTTRVGWGVPDLDRAMKGPGQLLGTFDVQLAPGQQDVWSNNLSDTALAARQKEDAAEHQAWQQTLIDKGWTHGLASNASQQEHTDYAIGMARDAAGAQREYQGSLIKSGAGSLTLNGANTYRGATTVNGGRLNVNGSLASRVTVNNSGSLGGTGRVGGLIANAGATVAPGNSIGTLQVDGNVTFEQGSTYAVELSTAHSDRLLVSGATVLNGGVVTLALENNPDVLTQPQARSMLGRQYQILQAAGGVQGQFASVVPNYLFIGASLDYSATAVQLGIERNATPFAHVAATPNQRAVAMASEQLGAGNAVYESVLSAPSIAVAQSAFQQLSGEIYPALGTMLINDSRQLRDAVGERLNPAGTRNAPPTAPNVWIKALGAWGKTDSRHDTADYTTSIGGLLAGVDGALDDNTQLGVLGGYSDSSLNMGAGTHSRATVDSYHVGTYLGHTLGAVRLSGAATYSWHRAEVKRDLHYNDNSAKQKTKRDAQTVQLFTEAAYRMNVPALSLEPFVNLAYIHLNSDGFTEKGDAAALKASQDQRDAVLSTVGLRALKTVHIAAQPLELAGSVGWQHALSSVDSDAHLRFASGGPSFAIESSPLVRNAARVGAHASLAINRDLRINLDYSGQLATQEKSHGVGLSLNWQF